MLIFLQKGGELDWFMQLSLQVADHQDCWEIQLSNSEE